MLNKTLMDIHNNLDLYFMENYPIPSYSKKEINLVLDIEVAPNKDKTEAITYSNALMSCDNESNICFFFDKVEDALQNLLSLKCEKVNVYVHNLFYDIKPYLIKFIETYGNNPIKEETFEKEYINHFKGEKEKLKVLKKGHRKPLTPFMYNLCLKKGQLYSAKFYGNPFRNEKGKEVPVEINFFDTYKIVPYSLQKCCNAFLDLQLPKDGLDYDKMRNIGDELNLDEKKYIYNDVFGLSHLVKKLIIKGFDINGKKVQYKKITNSSQSLYDYKVTLHDDYLNKKNAFSNYDFYEEVDNNLMKTKYFTMIDKNYDNAIDILFKTVFPPQNYFFDGWIRHSYYGGLSTVDFNNVEKYKKYKHKEGVVLDVNSLYPWCMQSQLLPFGQPSFDKKPYEKMNDIYKEKYPLYIQQITIYDMELKKGKMAFVQVKDNKDFNGRDVITTNVNLKGKKVPINLILCNPLIDLLFENYDIKSYSLGEHMAFKGSYNLFTNYLDYWGEIKRTSFGANREVAKLRQNALYGKFGSSGDNEITNVEINDSKFSVNHTHENYVSENIYVAMSSFITSYCKKYLVDAINSNRERFLYCDTDSMHLFGKIEEVKGVEIHKSKYGAWDNENSFTDFKYIGAKRYAEKLKISKSKNYKLDNFFLSKWEIKCAGLSDSIMKQVDDINVFDNCEYSSKELRKMKLYSKGIYYYKDENCTQKIIGLIKSKKAKIVKGGTLIIEQPYMINANNFYR